MFFNSDGKHSAANRSITESLEELRKKTLSVYSELKEAKAPMSDMRKVHEVF